MAHFTTSGTIRYNRYGLQLVGTGPHAVPDELLDLVTDELTAGGATCSAAVARVQVTIPSASAGLDTIPIFKAPKQIVLTNAYLVPAANVVGDTTDVNTYSIRFYDTGGTVGGTPFSYSGTAGTMVANVAQSLGSVSGGTVAANYTIDFYRGTAASGTAVPDMLLILEYTL